MMCGLTLGVAWDNAKESCFLGSLSVIHDLPLLPVVLHRCLQSLFLSHLKVKEVAELWLIHGLCFSLQLWRIWQTAELLTGCPAYLGSGCELELAFPPPVRGVSAFCISSLLWTRQLPLHEYWVKNRDGWKHIVALNWGIPWCVPLHELCFGSMKLCFGNLLLLGSAWRHSWNRDTPHPLLPPSIQVVSDTLHHRRRNVIRGCSPVLSPLCGASPPVAGPALFAKFTLVRAVGKPGLKRSPKSLGHRWPLALPPSPSTPYFSAGAGAQRLHKVE